MAARYGKDIAQLWHAKRHSRRKPGGLQINLTAMLDVMFNLLIFFLVAVSFNIPEALLSAKVPSTSGLSSETSVPLVPITVYLGSGEDVTVPSIRITSAVQADQATFTVVQDFQQLHQVLEQLQQKPGITDQTPVIIAARNQTLWDHVVNAYNAAVRARYKRVIFAGWKQPS